MHLCSFLEILCIGYCNNLFAKLKIADANNGGFPRNLNMKKNGGHGDRLEQKKHEMQVPGLVARLMGLEAMPIPGSQQDSSTKSYPNSDSRREGGRCSDGGFDGLVLSPEKGNVRPQKIQKIGVLEKRPITRLGAEALQIKNVLLRSRKHHRPKFASPVKSPKMGRTSSRLMDAAARILEPGIQASNQARCSLTYSNSMFQPCKEDLMSKMRVDVDLQTLSCRNYDKLLRGMDGRSGTNAPYMEKETEVVLLKTRYPPECVTTQLEDGGPIRNEVTRNNQSQSVNLIPEIRMYTSQKGMSPSTTVIKDRTQRSKVGSLQGRRVSAAKTSTSETKDFTSVNQNVNRNRLTASSKSYRSGNNGITERRFGAGKNDPLATQRSPVQKRRTVSGQASNASTTSLVESQRSTRANGVTINKTSKQGNRRVCKDTQKCV